MKNYLVVAILTLGLYGTVNAQDMSSKKADKKEMQMEKKQSKGKEKKAMKKENAMEKKDNKSK